MQRHSAQVGMRVCVAISLSLAPSCLSLPRPPSRPQLLRFVCSLAGKSIKDVDDERNCPFYLAGMCPYEMFSGTV